MMYDPQKTDQYLNPGDMAKLLSRADRLVYRQVLGEIKKTGLSKMATVLCCYRLVALGLIEEKPGRLNVKPRKKTTRAKRA